MQHATYLFAAILLSGVALAEDSGQRRMAPGGANAAGTTQSASTSTIALPTHTYRDLRTIAAGGDLLRLVHVERAHTDGDTIVKWTRADVLHMGDVYVRNGLPFIDLASGGSLAGVIAAVETALSLSDDRTVIIPGHGELATRSDLIEYRDRLNTIASAVAAEIRKGKSPAAIQTLRLADSWPRQAGAPVQPDEFIAMAYESYRHPL